MTATTATESVLSLSLGSASGGEGSKKVETLQEAAKALNNGDLYGDLRVYVEASDLTTLYKPMELSQFAKHLRPNAKVSVHVIECSTTTSLQPIHSSFLLAGLGSTTSERKEGNVRILTATRKTATTSNTVSLLIDENTLLDDTDLLEPPPSMSKTATKSDDCGGRLPCDDCTCGRKDELEGNKVEKNVAKSSACGKCGMGDAFRCASCPYLGKPAFKAGEEHLVLDLQDDL